MALTNTDCEAGLPSKHPSFLHHPFPSSSAIPLFFVISLATFLDHLLSLFPSFPSSIIFLPLPSAICHCSFLCHLPSLPSSIRILYQFSVPRFLPLRTQTDTASKVIKPDGSACTWLKSSRAFISVFVFIFRPQHEMGVKFDFNECVFFFYLWRVSESKREIAVMWRLILVPFPP